MRKVKIKKSAFTLAEVLIVLGIIGIIAEMTIPTLMQDTQDKELRVAWKKQFSMFSQALMEITTQYGGDIDLTSQESYRDSFLSVLKYTKNGMASNDFTIKYKCYKSTTYCWPLDIRYYALLTDGSIVYFDRFSSNCSGTRGTLITICGDLLVDVNGLKNPNMYGKDLYSMYVVKSDGAYKIVPDGTNDGFSCVLNSTTVETSEGCSTLALTDSQMP